MIPPNSTPDDPSNYGVVTYSPTIWRQSFSALSPRDKDVESSFAVDKNYSADILEVLQRSSSRAGSSMGSQLNWSPFSHRIWVRAAKLY